MKALDLIKLNAVALVAGLSSCRTTAISHMSGFLNLKPYTVAVPPVSYVCSSQEPTTQKNGVTIHYVSSDSKNNIVELTETYIDADQDKILRENEKISANLSFESQGQLLSFKQNYDPCMTTKDKQQTFVTTRNNSKAELQYQQWQAAYGAIQLRQIAQTTVSKNEAKHMLVATRVKHRKYH